MSDLPLYSRFQVLDRPLRNPGSCCVCGNPNRPVVDFGANLHQRSEVWVLYICLDCVREAYTVVDIASGDRAKREAEEGHSLESMLKARNLVGVTHEQYNAIVHIATDLGSVVDDLVDLDLEVEPSTDVGNVSEESRDGDEDDGGDNEPAIPISALNF